VRGFVIAGDIEPGASSLLIMLFFPQSGVCTLIVFGSGPSMFPSALLSLSCVSIPGVVVLTLFGKNFS